MPFTLSHPAIVLPLLRIRWVSVTGLLAGSMIPDFEYFLRLRVYGIYGHTWGGLFWFDLPLALLMAYLFHYLVWPVLFINLPEKIQVRLPDPKDFHWHEYVRQHFLVVILCILAGTASHIFWDSFTHSGTYFVRHWPFLRMQVDLGFQDYPMWHILQQISTVVGLFFVIVYVLKLPRKGSFTTNPKPLFWILLTIVVGGISFWRLWETGMHEIIKIGHVAVITMGATVYGLIIISIVWKLKS